MLPGAAVVPYVVRMTDPRSLIGVPGGRARVPTPALIVETHALDANIARMAARAAAAGLALRPHAKSHKSAAIAAKQVAAGAAGVCCAKLGEAAALMAAGVRDILVTSPVATPALAARAAALARADPGSTVVVDHPAGVAALADATAGGGVTLSVLIDVDVGQGRTGVADADAAVALADQIAAAPGLRLAGVQGYAGHVQHIAGATARAAANAASTARLRDAVDALRAAGHAAPWVTGGGTGSFAADVAGGVLTEVQPGSYVFMDVDYRAALGSDPDGGFATSLFVAATVVSVNRPDWVTVDAGLKAFATDGPVPVAATPRFVGCAYAWAGDEHGRLARPAGGGDIVPGERVEFAVPHCDPTVDRYSHFVFVAGDTVVAVVPIDAARASQ